MNVRSAPWRDVLLTLDMVRAEHRSGAHALLEALQDALVYDVVLFEGGAFAESRASVANCFPRTSGCWPSGGCWSTVRFEVETVRAGEGSRAVSPVGGSGPPARPFGLIRPTPGTSRLAPRTATA